jgi:hypothetical protein
VPSRRYRTGLSNGRGSVLSMSTPGAFTPRTVTFWFGVAASLGLASYLPSFPTAAEMNYREAKGRPHQIDDAWDSACGRGEGRNRE